MVVISMCSIDELLFVRGDDGDSYRSCVTDPHSVRSAIILESGRFAAAHATRDRNKLDIIRQTIDDAHARASSLADGVGDLTDGSYAGSWSLPTGAQSVSLGRGPESVNLSHPGFFTGINLIGYWTSVSNGTTSLALYFWFGESDIHHYFEEKRSALVLWPVRYWQKFD